MTAAEASLDAKPGEEPATVVLDEVAVDSGASASTSSSSSSNGSNSNPISPEEQREWMEQRIRSRLQGDYERAGRALGSLVSDNLDTPMRLNAIRIIGAKHTRAGFLGRVASPYLLEPSTAPSASSSYTSPASSSFTSYIQSLLQPTSTTSPTGKDKADAPFPVHPQSTQTLRDVLSKTQKLSDDLAKFGIFEEGATEAGLEMSRDVLADIRDVDLVLKVQEKSRYFLRTATDAGDGEGNVTATARIRNAFGGAETLEGNMSSGTRTKSSFEVRLSTPLFASPYTTLSINGFAMERDLTYYAACKESLRGTKLDLKTPSPFGEHTFAYEGVLRNMCDVGPTASMSIRNAAGLSVKSALSHTLIRDTRDDPFIASRGSYLRLMQEYAGLGGDASFAKSETDFHFSRLIGAGCSLSMSLRTGLLYPLGGRPSHFLDRFQLGGPTSVRMFKMNGLGPRDHNDFIGGDLQWSAGLSLVTPIPKREDWPLKGHFFINAGRLVGFNETLAKSLSDLTREPAVSAGFGLMYRHSIVRAELNFGMPIAAHKGDGVRKGLQIGLGLHFL